MNRQRDDDSIWIVGDDCIRSWKVLGKRRTRRGDSNFDKRHNNTEQSRKFYDASSQVEITNYSSFSLSNPFANDRLCSALPVKTFFYVGTVKQQACLPR